MSNESRWPDESRDWPLQDTPLPDVPTRTEPEEPFKRRREEEQGDRGDLQGPREHLPPVYPDDDDTEEDVSK